VGVPPRRRGLAGAAALALLALALVGAAPAGARAGWDTPFRFAQPFSFDILPPHIAFAVGGAAAVNFSVQDADDPSRSRGYVAWRSASGRRTAPVRVPSTQQVLNSAFSGSKLELLTGNSPAGNACCSSAAIRTMTGKGRFGRAHTLVRGLAGTASSRLLALPGGLFAAVATNRGVWAAQSSPRGRFGGTHRLTGVDSRPQEMRTAELGNGRAAVAWTETDRFSGPSAARQIFLATSSANAAPTRGRAAVTVAAGHSIDDLGLADGTTTGAPAVAWVEDWYDRHGNYRSKVVVRDLAPHGQRRTYAVRGTIASGLAFVDNGRGDQVLAWRTCTFSATCAAHVAWRRGRGGFGGASRVGFIDDAEVPTAAVAATGEALVGWIHHGHVMVADLRPRARKFSASHTVSSTDYAADLTIGFGPAGGAIAAWSQGTLAPDVIGAVYKP
jgi:hypothetical protein